jgi:hypothetical protein
VLIDCLRAFQSASLPIDLPGSCLSLLWRCRTSAAQRLPLQFALILPLGFPSSLPTLQPLQRAAPEDVELGKPLAAQGLEAMEALRLVVRQDHVAAVQVACAVRKVSEERGGAGGRCSGGGDGRGAQPCPTRL